MLHTLSDVAPKVAPAADPPVRLADGLDCARIGRVFAAAGRVHIAPIFAADCAQRIFHELSTGIAWQLHLNDGDRPINLRGDGFDALPEEERRRFLAAVYESAGSRFQYLYSSFPVSDLAAKGEQPHLYVMRVHEFLNSPGFLSFAREITGQPAITFADAQATLYRPGHFLTRHDDAMEGKNRLVAYVLNFTPAWQTDWGGILQFIDRDGHVAEGYAPVFNALNLFRVPQAHSVSYVSPFARHGRYSITGWLRSGSPR